MITNIEDKKEYDKHHGHREEFNSYAFWLNEVDRVCQDTLALINNRISAIAPAPMFDNMTVLTEVCRYNMIEHYDITASSVNLQFYSDLSVLLLATLRHIKIAFTYAVEDLILSEISAIAFNRLWRASESMRQDTTWKEYLDEVSKSTENGLQKEIVKHVSRLLPQERFY